MKKLFTIIGIVFIYATSHSEVWSGVNLGFLTDAHNDFVKEYPCIVETVHYEVIEMFGEVSKGDVTLKKYVSYDEKGYVKSEVTINNGVKKEIVYNNEYSGERIVKRTAFQNDDILYVYKYSYDTGGVVINKYNGSGRFVEKQIYKVVGGVLQRYDETANESKSTTKYNSSGLPVENVFKNPAFNLNVTTQYDKSGMIVKRSSNIKGLYIGTTYSEYKINSKGDWISRMMTPVLKMDNAMSQYRSLMSGQLSDELLIASMLGGGKNPEIQERVFLNSGEYESLLLAEEQRKIEQAERIRLSEEIEKEQVFLSNLRRNSVIPNEYIKHNADILIDLSKAIWEIENMRKGDASVSPIQSKFMITIGNELEVQTIAPTDDESAMMIARVLEQNNHGGKPIVATNSSEIEVIRKVLQQSNYTPLTLYLQHLDSTIIIPRSITISINELRQELVSPTKKSKGNKIFSTGNILSAAVFPLNPAYSMSMKLSQSNQGGRPSTEQKYKCYPVDIKLKKEKSTGQWYVTNWDEIIKNGFDKESIGKDVLNYIEELHPERKNIKLTVKSYTEPMLMMSFEQVDNNIIIHNDKRSVYQMSPQYRYDVK